MITCGLPCYVYKCVIWVSESLIDKKGSSHFRISGFAQRGAHGKWQRHSEGSSRCDHDPRFASTLLTSSVTKCFENLCRKATFPVVMPQKLMLAQFYFVVLICEPYAIPHLKELSCLLMIRRLWFGSLSIAV